MTQRQLGANVRGSRLMPSLSEEKKKTKIASSHEKKNSHIKILTEKKRKIASSHVKKNISLNENIKR